MMYPLVWLFGDTYFSVVHHSFQSPTRFTDRYYLILPKMGCLSVSPHPKPLSFRTRRL